MIAGIVEGIAGEGRELRQRHRLGASLETAAAMSFTSTSKALACDRTEAESLRNSVQSPREITVGFKSI